jgi:tRNA-specific 2-thiouridylase
MCAVRVLVAMSGGVDSSVAAALLLEQGHAVTGATMKLWGGAGDSGCCSLADVADARRVADQLGIEHHVYNFADDFERDVVAPYASAHAAGRTPNPCVECNRHLKFDRFLSRARRLGFEAAATGHHARIVRDPDGAPPSLRRGRDRVKDQSYVLAMLQAAVLEQVLLPVGELTKLQVRAIAAERGLRTAEKAESQDVCFIASRTPGAGRGRFLAERIELHRGRVLDARSGAHLGDVDALELVTVGQRRGLGAATGSPCFALEVDVAARTVLAGAVTDLETDEIVLGERTWVREPLETGRDVLAQCSAHGEPRPAVTTPDGLRFYEPARRVAPGQLVALYLGDQVVGSGVAERCSGVADREAGAGRARAPSHRQTRLPVAPPRR